MEALKPNHLLRSPRPLTRPWRPALTDVRSRTRPRQRQNVSADKASSLNDSPPHRSKSPTAIRRPTSQLPRRRQKMQPSASVSRCRGQPRRRSWAVHRPVSLAGAAVRASLDFQKTTGSMASRRLTQARRRRVRELDSPGVTRGGFAPLTPASPDRRWRRQA